jgi:hypothetical protein
MEVLLNKKGEIETAFGNQLEKKRYHVQIVKQSSKEQTNTNGAIVNQLKAKTDTILSR